MVVVKEKHFVGKAKVLLVSVSTHFSVIRSVLMKFYDGFMALNKLT